VALGRAIVRHPRVFLFDEPLSNLDAKLRVQMRREIAALHRRLATTTVYVTHDQVEAMTLGDRIVVMRAGRVLQVDPPSAIYQQPADTFVATFIGSPPMNLIRGRVRDGSFLSEAGDFRVPIGSAGPGERPIILGLRPESVRLVAPDGGSPAEVQLVEPLGSETLVTLMAGATPIVARLEGISRLRPQDRVGLQAAPDAAHWFDPDSENRLPDS
jgi:multiple sugar transport system ATP-binding protein